MWRLWNWLFGWQYVAVKTCSGMTVARADDCFAYVYGKPNVILCEGKFHPTYSEGYCVAWWPLTSRAYEYGMPEGNHSGNVV